MREDCQDTARTWGSGPAAAGIDLIKIEIYSLIINIRKRIIFMCPMIPGLTGKEEGEGKSEKI